MCHWQRKTSENGNDRGRIGLTVNSLSCFVYQNGEQAMDYRAYEILSQNTVTAVWQNDTLTVINPVLLSLYLLGLV